MKVPTLFFCMQKLLFINADRTIFKPAFKAFVKNLKCTYEFDQHVHLMKMTYDKFIKTELTPDNRLVA